MSETPKSEEELALEAATKLVDEQAEIDAEAEQLKNQEELDFELAKYTAASWDRASTALVGLGIFAPVLGLAWGAYRKPIIDLPTALVTIVICLLVAIALHSRGRDILREVFEE